MVSFKHVLSFKYVLSLIRFLSVLYYTVLSLHTGNGFFSITVIVFVAHAQEFKIIQKLEDTQKSLCTRLVNMLSFIEQQGSSLVCKNRQFLLWETACSYFLFNILFFFSIIRHVIETSFTEIHMFCFSSRLVIFKNGTCLSRCGDFTYSTT